MIAKSEGQRGIKTCYFFIIIILIFITTNYWCCYYCDYCNITFILSMYS